MNRNMKKTYLITGGQGFIGKAISLSLLDQGNKVIIFDNNFRKKNFSLKHKNLQLINGDIRNIKLPAGSAITYRTGIPHCVNDVTKGHRDVAVFWTRTMFKDPYDLMLIRGIRKAMQLLEYKQCANLEEAREDPYFILATLMHNIERKNLLKNNDNS